MTGLTGPRAEPSSDPAEASMVRLEAVTVFYGEVVGLSAVTLAAKPGILGVVGPNGSGKSTLMRVLTGCTPASEGRVSVFGDDPFVSARSRSRVAIVPTPECFSAHLSGARNAELAWLARGATSAEARDRARLALSLAELEADGDRRYGAWSRGMKQRLKVGFALSTEADLVLLDEPYLGVDPPNRRRLRELVVALAAQGRTVLIASHVLSEVDSLTKHIAVLMHGRLLGLGHVSDLLLALRDRHPHRVRVVASQARALGASLLAHAHVVQVQARGEEELEVWTTRPDRVYTDLAHAAAGCGALPRLVQSDDDSLDAVFRGLTSAGATHLEA